MDPEAAARAIVNEAKAARKRPSRGMWIAAIAVAIVCLACLSYGLVDAWDEEPTKTTMTTPPSTSGSGFALGIMIGIAAGIAIGSLIATRKR